VARLCAQEAGGIIMAHFGRHEQMVAKGRGNFVTDADLAAEHAVLGLLRQEAGTADALAWIEACTQSGRCSAACPEGINAMKMMRVARMSALGSLGAPRKIAPREEKGFFRRIGAFSQLQFSADEIEKWQR